jgi:hypothetical protein
MFNLNVPNYNVTIHDITGGNNIAYLDKFLSIFVQLLPAYEFAVPTLKKIAQRPNNFNPALIEHQWLMEINGQPAGMTVFKYAAKRGLGFGLYLGILPEYRKIAFGEFNRLSEFVVAATRVQLQIDALELGQQIPVGYLAESIEPKLVSRYEKDGFTLLDINYLEPLLPGGRITHVSSKELGKTEFHSVYLGIFPIGYKHINANDPTLLQNATLALLVDHYNLPENHRVVQQTLDSIKNKQKQLEGISYEHIRA